MAFLAIFIAKRTRSNRGYYRHSRGSFVPQMVAYALVALVTAIIVEHILFSLQLVRIFHPKRFAIGIVAAAIWAALALEFGWHPSDIFGPGGACVVLHGRAGDGDRTEQCHHRVSPDFHAIAKAGRS